MKRFFVIPYLIALTAVSGIAVWQALTVSPIWLLAVVACGPMLWFMMSIMINKKGRTREHLYPELGLAVVASVTALVFSPSLTLPVLCLALGVGGILLYDFWYSQLGRGDTSLLEKGKPLPDFTLHDAEGLPFESSSMQGSKTVWMFIRGNWCPLCVAQVRELAECYRQIHALGGQVVVITPQPADETRKMAERFSVPMVFAVDQDGAAAGKLGLLHEGGVPAGMMGYGGDTVYPTVLISDENGKIIYSDQTDNYRMRPEPEEFLKVLAAN